MNPSRKDTNLFSLSQTKKLFTTFNPDIVINAAAKVGGILANDLQRTEFILNNLKININIIESITEFPETKLINLEVVVYIHWSRSPNNRIYFDDWKT